MVKDNKIYSPTYTLEDYSYTNPENPGDILFAQKNRELSLLSVDSKSSGFQGTYFFENTHHGLVMRLVDEGIRLKELNSGIVYQAYNFEDGLRFAQLKPQVDSDIKKVGLEHCLNTSRDGQTFQVVKVPFLSRLASSMAGPIPKGAYHFPPTIY